VPADVVAVRALREALVADGALAADVHPLGLVEEVVALVGDLASIL
jgi:hypothetical protein